MVLIDSKSRFSDKSFQTSSVNKILFVCLGNICRSPAAEGILSQKLSEQGLVRGQDFIVDSAGTNAWVDSHPDVRSQQVCQEHGIDISGQVGRKLTSQDGQNFDYLYCMNDSNVTRAKIIIPSEYHNKIKLINGSEISDPYLSGADGFEKMYSQLDRAIDGIIPIIVS